jgi:hypothetical protein
MYKISFAILVPAWIRIAFWLFLGLLPMKSNESFVPCFHYCHVLLDRITTTSGVFFRIFHCALIRSARILIV